MKILRASVVLLAFFFILTGLLFPLAVTAAAQALFPKEAGGSLVAEGGRVIGSDLVGQSFAKPEFFHPRPSAAGSGCDAGNSGGTNLGPTSDKLINGIPDDPKTKADETYLGVKQLAALYRQENGLDPHVVLPSDAVTRSASGLDPHISLRNAELQAGRVARARGLDKGLVLRLVRQSADPAFLGIFGDTGINVLRLNRALLRASSSP